MIMVDDNTSYYEVYFSSIEGNKSLRYIAAASQQDAKDRFLSQIKESVNIFHVLPVVIDIYED